MATSFIKSCKIGASTPLPGASFVQANTRALAHSFKFSGRASRSEYWWATLGIALVTCGAEFYAHHNQKAAIADAGKHYPEPEIDHRGMPLPGELKRVWKETQSLEKAHPVASRKMADALMLLAAVPSLSLSVRRLHDTNRSGHWMWINCVPVLGNIVSLVQSSQSSHPLGSRFD